MKYLTNFDLNKNQLLNVVAQKLASDPASPGAGQFYYNTVENCLKFYNGTAWKKASEMTGDDIITAINGASGTIADARLSSLAQTAITNSHTHTNKAVLDATTASFTTALQTKLNGIAASADVTSATNIAPSIASATAKTSLVDADVFAILNSASSNVLSQITWANVKTVLKSYTDTLYNNYAHPTTDGNLHVPATGTTNNGKVLTAGSTAGSFSWTTPAVDWVNITNKPSSTVANIDAAVTNMHTHANKALLDTYTQTEANLADAVSKKHTQNTDAGTSNGTFYIGSGVKLKNSGGTELQIRNNADTGYADIRVNNIYIEGSTTQINSNTVNIGDSEIELNTDITTAAQNSDGGIAVKRLKADNTTRADAKMTYSESIDRWTTTQGDVAGALVTAVIANKVSASIGDGSATSYVVTHNLNTQDVSVTIRETASPFALVYTDVEITSVNTITIKFAAAPTSGQYTVVVVG